MILYNIGWLECKFCCCERVVIGKFKFFIFLCLIIKSKCKIKVLFIDGLKEELEGLFVLGKGKEKGKEYRIMLEIVKIY